MTRVYLSQHASAYSKDEDPSRRLTPQGKQEVTKVAEFLSRKQLQLDVIYHSGKARAEETATLFAQKLWPSATVVTKKGLLPLDEVTIIGDEIKAGTSRNSLYVGHLPHMEKLASYLLCGDPVRNTIKFSNGGIVCLEQVDQGWMVPWSIVPELL